MKVYIFIILDCQITMYEIKAWRLEEIHGWKILKIKIIIFEITKSFEITSIEIKGSLDYMEKDSR